MRKIRKIAIGLLSFCVCALLGVGTFFTLDTAKASAAISASVEVTGASLRVPVKDGEDNYTVDPGIKFHTEISAEYFSNVTKGILKSGYKTGLLILPTRLLNASAYDVLTVDNAASLTALNVDTTDYWSFEDGVMQANVMLNYIKGVGYGTDLTVRAYVYNGTDYIYSDGGESGYSFSFVALAEQADENSKLDDAQIEAIVDEYATFTVTIKDKNGNVLSTQDVIYGEKAPMAGILEYVSSKDNTTAWDPNRTVTADTTLVVNASDKTVELGATELDLDVTAANNALTTSASLTFDLASVGLDKFNFGSDYNITSLTVGGESATTTGATVSGSTLTIPASNFPYAYGESEVALKLSCYGSTITLNTDALFISKKISDKAELDGMNTIMAAYNANGKGYAGYYELDEDITYNTPTKAGETLNVWTPAIVDYNSDGFVGTFDGCGHVINGFYLTHRFKYAFITEIGEDGVVKNVAFTNAIIGGSAALVSCANNGLIQNVYAHYWAYGVWGATPSNGKSQCTDYFNEGNSSRVTTFNVESDESAAAIGIVENVFVDMTDVQTGNAGTTWLQVSKQLFPLGWSHKAGQTYDGVYLIGAREDGLRAGYQLWGPGDKYNWYVTEEDFDTARANNENIANEVNSWPIWMKDLMGVVEVTELSTRQDVNLDLLANGKVVSTNEAATSVIDLTEGGNVTEVYGVTYNDQPVEYTFTGTELSISVDEFGMKFGDATITVVTNTGKFLVPVRLVSKVIKTAADLDAMNHIAKALSADQFTFDGYFQLGNDIAYNGNYLPMMDFSLGVAIAYSDTVVSELTTDADGYLMYKGRYVWNYSTWKLIQNPDMSKFTNNGGTLAYNGGNCRLTNATTCARSMGWSGTGFIGTFDGCGYTIDGLKVGDGKATYVSFIPVLAATGVIKNVAFTNAKFDNASTSSGFLTLLGKAGSRIENVYVQLIEAKGDTMGVIQVTNDTRSNAGSTIRNVLVDTTNVTLTSSKFLAFSGTTQTGVKYGVLNGAYAVVNNATQQTKAFGAGGAQDGSENYAAFVGAKAFAEAYAENANLKATFDTLYEMFGDTIAIASTIPAETVEKTLAQQKLHLNAYVDKDETVKVAEVIGVSVGEAANNLTTVNSLTYGGTAIEGATVKGGVLLVPTGSAIDITTHGEGKDLVLDAMTEDRKQYIITIPTFFVTSLITTAEELQDFGYIAKAVGDKLNGRTDGQISDGYFELGKDIAYNGTYVALQRRGSAPLYWEAGNAQGFAGVFDGCGYAIDGMTAGTGYSANGTISGYAAFIPILHKDGIIRNVAFTNATVNNDGKVGGFLLGAGQGLVENVYVQLTAAEKLNVSGVIFGTDNVRSVSGPTLRNVFVDTTAVTTTNAQFYAVGGNLNDQNGDGVIDPFGIYDGVYAIVNNATQQTKAFGAGGAYAGSVNYAAYAGKEAFVEAYAEDANLKATFDTLYEMFGDAIASSSIPPAETVEKTLAQQKLHLNAYVDEDETVKVAEVIGVNVGEVANNLTIVNSLTYGGTAIEGATVTGGVLLVPTGSAIDITTHGEGKDLVLDAMTEDRKQYIITIPTFFVTSLITTAEELQDFGYIAKAVGDKLNGLTNGKISDGYFELGNDIAYNGTYSAWQSRGAIAPLWWDTGAAQGFAGTFDGCGFTIENMTVVKPATGNYGAFIPVLHKDGIIKNVAFTGAQNKNNVGAFLVGSGCGRVENVYIQFSSGDGNTWGVLYGINNGNNAGDIILNNVLVDTTSITADFGDGRPIYAIGGVQANKTIGIVSNAYAITGTAAQAEKAFGETGATSKTNAGAYYGKEAFAEAYWADSNMKAAVDAISEYFGLGLDFSAYEPQEVSLDEAQNLNLGVDNTATMNNSEATVNVASAAEKLGALGTLKSVTLAKETSTYALRNTTYEVQGATLVDNQLTIPFAGNETIFSATTYGDYTMTIVTNSYQTIILPVSVVSNVINTREELIALGDIAEAIGNANGNSYDGYFKLGADIAYSEGTLTEGTGGGKFNCWRPWFTTLDTDGFNGIFDGNGYSINGLIIGCLGVGVEQAFITEIGENGVLRNVAFTNMVIGGGSSGITELNSGLVEDVYVHVRAFGGWVSGADEGRYTNYNYGWCGSNTAVINGAASYADGTIRNIFVDMADTLITTTDGGKTTDENGNPIIHKEVTDGVNVGNWAADPDEMYPFGQSDRATYENIYVVGVPNTEPYLASKTLKRDYLYWCETMEEFAQLCAERTQIRNIIKNSFNEQSWKIINGVPSLKYASVNQVIGEIDLDLDVSHATGITYGNLTAELKLSDIATNFGSLVLVNFNGNEIDATYNAERQLLCLEDLSGFGTAYGEQKLELTFADGDGKEHTFSVGVLLISKKISNKAELDMMGLIARACSPENLLQWGGYFVLDSNIDYANGTWTSFINPGTGSTIKNVTALNEADWTKSFDGYYLYKGQYVSKAWNSSELIPYQDDKAISEVFTLNAGNILYNGVAISTANGTGAQLGWGTNIASKGFMGTFDGQGFTISNFKTPSWNIGSFISIVNGTIKDVAFTNVTANASGGVVATGGCGTIENVYVQVNKIATDTSDGTSVFFAIPNADMGTLQMINCFVDATAITAASNNVGLIGSLGNASNKGKNFPGSMTGVYAIGGAEGSLGVRYVNSDGAHVELKSVYPAADYETFRTKDLFLAQVNTYGSDVYNAIVNYPQWLQDQILGKGYNLPEAPTVDMDDNYFVQNAATEYVLVVGAGKPNTEHYSMQEENDIRKAVEFIVEQVKAATGATIKVEFAPDTWDANKKMIVFGDWNLFDQAQASLNDGEYGVIRTGNSIFIMADDATDYQIAAIKFLEEVLGYRAYAADSKGSYTTELADDSVIKDAEFNGFIEYLNVANNTVAMPASINFTNGNMFNYRQSGTFSLASAEQSYVMGAYEYDKNIYGGWHNTFEFVNPEESYTVNGTTYGTWASTKAALTDVYSTAGTKYSNGKSASYTTVSHPWYATTYQTYYTRSGNFGSFTWPSNTAEVAQSSSAAYQLCFTAHGNATAYNDLVALVGGEMIARANAHPEYDIFGFTQQDNAWACACAACTAMGNPSDTILAFLDDVLEYVNGSENLKRPAIKIAYFAYNAYMPAPTSYDYDGDAGNVDLNPNTYLVLAPIGAYYDEIMNTGTNATTDAWANSAKSAWSSDWSDMEAWLSKTAASGVQIFLWLYELNQYEWFTTRNSFKANVGNIRLFAEYDNIDLIQIENLWHQANGSAFSQLKAYLNAQAMMEVNKYVTVTDGKVNETELNAYYETLVNEFFGRNADGTFTNKGYYGPAGESMYKYYQAQQAALAYFDEANETGKQTYWSKFSWSQFTDADYNLNNWDTSLYWAYKRIIDAGSLSEDQKAMYIERVNIESLTYRWLVCQGKANVPDADFASLTFGESAFSEIYSTNLTTFRKAFLNDVKNFGYAYYASGTEPTLFSIEDDWFGSNTIFTAAPETSY